MADRAGDWFQTFSGRQFWPLDPRADEVDIKDIAHALANICRFGGHCISFYSVAQHCLLVSRLVPDHLRLAALLHDAAEAYIGDMVRPLKRFIPQFREIEHHIEAVIGQHFEVALVPMDPAIKRADEIALMTEKRDVVGPSPQKWNETATPAAETVVPLRPVDAERLFLLRFRELWHGSHRL